MFPYIHDISLAHFATELYFCAKLWVVSRTRWKTAVPLIFYSSHVLASKTSVIKVSTRFKGISDIKPMVT